MAAKPSSAKPSAAKKASPPQHPPYKEMIKEAILALKERNGSSRPALKKYIKANYKGVDTDRFDGLFNQTLKRGGDAKEFAFPKGPSGTVKLAKKEPAPKPTVVKKPVAASKPTTTKTAAKKPVAKKPVAKKVAVEKERAPKKAPAKPKANAKKPRKESAAAPAVVEKPATVLTKTKSGRVSKGTAAAKPVSKAKKATPKKKSPKKSASTNATPAAA